MPQQIVNYELLESLLSISKCICIMYAHTYGTVCICQEKRQELFHGCVACGVSKVERSTNVYTRARLSFLIRLAGFFVMRHHYIEHRDVQLRQDGLEDHTLRYFLSFQHISIPSELDRTFVEDTIVIVRLCQLLHVVENYETKVGSIVMVFATSVCSLLCSRWCFQGEPLCMSQLMLNHELLTTLLSTCKCLCIRYAQSSGNVCIPRCQVPVSCDCIHDIYYYFFSTFCYPCITIMYTRSLI